nr:MAG TPA: hypothetical protein [Caudoviricetes sp.]
MAVAKREHRWYNSKKRTNVRFYFPQIGHIL